MRGELARLEHERVAGRQARRDLPGGLEERVVPRGDQAADADGLVHDPADDVGVAGVDHPAGLLGRDPAVVAEHRGDVGDVVLALDEALAGVERLQPGEQRRRRGRSGRRPPAAGRPGRAPGAAARRPGGTRGAPRRWPARCPRRWPRRPRRPGSRRPGSGSRGALHPARSSTRRRGRALPPDPLPARATHTLRMPQHASLRATGCQC